ncbi:Protein roadkill like protein [Argiope bruennichi]|uniref:Protein roadkill like protein n=1 Tax=Argiope bruennichi TaxID=94029 RepID=A0A8T0EL28_ARGBR|nr:Protein roadkill like protein [Argiope bruennichi]
MATSEISPEDELHLDVYWKIKNFSYCIVDIISPEFNVCGFKYCLILLHKCADVECKILNLDDCSEITYTKTQISFQTTDSSEEEFVSDSKLVVSKDAIFGNRRSAFLPGDTLTIRFRSTTSSEKSFFMCSQIVVKRKYFLLNFNTLGKYGSELQKCIEKSDLYGRIQLNLTFMNGIDSAEQFHIEISKTGGRKCLCVLKVSVLDVEGKALNEVSDNFFLSRKVVNKPKCFLRLSRHSNDESSIISYCENARPLMKESEDLSLTFKEKNVPGSATELQADLKSILDTGTLFDVSLQIDTEFIQAHKIILSARSPVFNSVFTKHRKENNNIVVIEDLDVDTLRKLLLYMYTDTIFDDHWENIKKLYFAANKFEIPSLKKKCVSILKTNLSISNVCEAACLADLHQDNDVKTATIDFIFEHDFEVFASVAWMELESNNSPLAFRIMHEIHRNIRMRFA